WVLTPLLMADGDAVVVNRGWFSNSGQYEAVPESFAAPTGPVSVTGLVRQTETRGSFGPTDPEGQTVTNLARVDIGRLDQQVPEDLLPLYIQLEQQDPAVTQTDPVPVPVPLPDEGPHLSYAVQWFIFSTVALIGYPMILVRRARDKGHAAKAVDQV
ncbi:MAG: SURF1 family protein, partial [Aquihabitans sp.]